MNTHQKIQLVIAALFGASSIALAAAGAHAFHDTLLAEGLLTTFKKAVNYAQYHALALLALVALQQLFTTARFHWVGYAMALGTALFSGSLLLHTLAGWHGIVFLTPVGGTLLIVAWLLLGVLGALVPKR